MMIYEYERKWVQLYQNNDGDRQLPNWEAVHL